MIGAPFKKGCRLDDIGEAPWLDEEKVDEEELARLESTEGGASTKIRVKMPNSKINEMFALAEQILGGRRVNVLCADGEMRLARIPGKMRRRQWVREGDLIIVWALGLSRFQG